MQIEAGTLAFDEMNSINLSLNALKEVLHQLSKGVSNGHMYRQNMLTMVLGESLGGNSKTTVLVRGPSKSL